MQPAIPYDPDLEQPRPDEAQTIAGLQDALREIMDTTSENMGRAVRSVHAKAHGYLTATLTIPQGLPPELAQGMLTAPGAHPAILRFSTNPGDILDDSVSLPRGLGLKVLDVSGPRLPGAGGNTQDFLMVNGPVFLVADPAKFLANLRLLAKTTDRLEWAKKALSFVLRNTERAIEAVGLQSGALQAIGGARNVHPLGETYYSQTPFRHGAHVAKYALFPVSHSLTRHTDQEIDASGRPDAIRETMDLDTREAPMIWELRAQLCRDPEAMPIEDPTVPWDETVSPWQTVARIEAPAQVSFQPGPAERADDNLRFSVWTGLADHQPLGAINRARRDSYQMSADYRGRFNGCPMAEPTSAAIARQG